MHQGKEVADSDRGHSQAQDGNPESMFMVARESHLKGDYQAALDGYHQAGDLGFIKALNNIGVIIEARGWNGSVPEDSDDNPLKWFRKGAELGDPSAIYNLARCMETGWWLTMPDSDSKEFDEWYEKYAKTVHDLHLAAANHGMAPAMCSLGYIYLNGNGVPKNEAKAIEWFSLAAANGDVEASDKLKELNV